MTAPIIVVVAPVRIGPQKLATSSTVRAVSGSKCARVQRQGGPAPRLHRGLHHKGRRADQEYVAHRPRQQPAMIPAITANVSVPSAEVQA